MTQQSYFDGRTFNVADDGQRLTRQLDLVQRCLQDGQWWTLTALAAVTGGSEAGVSARIRDLKKPRFGGYVIEKERVSGGLWRYRIARCPYCGSILINRRCPRCDA